MHKITKGLKKKKKGKKSKHKEEELFKPEELEAYRREHQQQQQENEETATAGENEEWKKFIALTAGVDDILKKTQGDLDRIKSTSFFQRIPPPSEVKRQEEEEVAQKEAAEQKQQEDLQVVSAAEAAIVQVSESESEEEDEEDIFDTSYIDAIAAGEVKLAYIPESPTEQPEGDDPFDTSIAERAILGPAVERKGKKLVPIGSAVEVLTGRVQAPTCATKRPISRRQILKERDLLLGSFDSNANSVPNEVKENSPEKQQPSLLDDDAPLPLADEPIDLSKTLHQIPESIETESRKQSLDKGKNILEEFDVIKTNEICIEDDEDEEFAILAAESLSKKPTVVETLPITEPIVPLHKDDWNAFEEERKNLELKKTTEEEALEEDPFDTTFAENILPGKAELKVIESEILNSENDFDFNPRAGERLAKIINKVSIHITNPAGQKESVSSIDQVLEADLNPIQPIHRDLLGGSNTDLSNLGDQPLKPSETVDENYIEYCDPFDTSIIENVVPGQTELKFIEKELLGDIKSENKDSLSDEEFDPRADEPQRERTISRPDILNITPVKAVSFDLPSPDLLNNQEEEIIKVCKPLTPYYVRKSSIPEATIEEDLNSDPFDTSFVSEVAPGKAELKLIENELFNPEKNLKHSISDQNFDPRDDKQVAVAKVVQTIKEISNPTSKTVIVEKSKPIDLLGVDDDVAGKVLTPAAETLEDFSEISYSDPFDTSIANNILPGKTELKLLETELIHSEKTIKRNLTDPEFDPRILGSNNNQIEDLFNSEDAVIDKPLSPFTQSVSFDIGETEDIDPFDTSIANNIGPGRTELKLLESELI